MLKIFTLFKTDDLIDDYVIHELLEVELGDAIYYKKKCRNYIVTCFNIFLV